MLINSVGAKLTFILQPLATWGTKRLSHEENQLFTALDLHPSNFWKSFQPILTSRSRA